jgi:predicted MFS family arabinose efflux permease
MRPPEDELGSGVRRRFTGGVLATSMALAILPMVSLGILAPLVIDDLDMSRADLGLLVSLASGVSALCSPVAGDVVDRIGDRTALLAVFGFGATSLALMAGSGSYAAMAVALGVAGLCHAGANPSTNRLISGRVPPGRRGTITGVKQAGETVAIALAAAILPATAVWLGWRVALGLLAGAALAALAIATVTIHGSRRPAENSPVGRRGELRRSIYWLSAYSFAMGAAGGAVTTYLPLYAHDSGGFSVAAAGSVMIFAGVVGTAGRVTVTSWSESRAGIVNTLVWLALIAALSGLALLAAPLLGGPAYWLAAALWGAGGLTFGAVGMLAVMAESDEWNTGRASGLAVFGFGMGLTVLPPVFGLIVDLGYGYGTALTLVTLSYAAAAGIILMGRHTFREAGSRAVALQERADSISGVEAVDSDA